MTSIDGRHRPGEGSIRYDCAWTNDRLQFKIPNNRVDHEVWSERSQRVGDR